MNYLPKDPIEPEFKSSIQSYLLILGRPSSAELELYDRREKYQILKTNTEHRREQLISFIKEHGLQDEVERIGEPTVFNTLFIDCTERAAELIAEAPGVESIEPSGDFSVDLSSK